MRISLPFDDGALGRLLVSRIVTGNDRNGEADGLFGAISRH
jgi:hypothetical protein